MIQRIQSLWLLLATGAIILAIELPFGIEQNASGQTREIMPDSNMAAYLLGWLLSIGAFISIFLFKRRSNQKRIIWLSILSCILFIVLMYFQVETAKNTDQHSAQFRIGAVFPILYIILMAMAYAGIRKDEKLIKSVDRLR